MSWYEDRVLPHVIDLLCGMRSAERLRARTCAGLHGRVLEIGFGTGLNVPFYPTGVELVSAIEPADRAWQLAGKRLAASSTAVDRAGLDGQSLPFDDDTFDTAVSTWTMCTIPDVDAAVREVRRVLKPGGTFHFVEHGLAPDAKVQKWQRRLDPVQQRLFGGCHLTRSVPDMLAAGSFEIRDIESFYEPATPKFVGAFTIGVAA